MNNNKDNPRGKSKGKEPRNQVSLICSFRLFMSNNNNQESKEWIDRYPSPPLSLLVFSPENN
jgi:hypothetical protein